MTPLRPGHGVLRCLVNLLLRLCSKHTVGSWGHNYQTNQIKICEPPISVTSLYFIGNNFLPKDIFQKFKWKKLGTKKLTMAKKLLRNPVIISCNYELNNQNFWCCSVNFVNGKPI